MAAPSIQQAFNAGEISPELYGEVSLAKYGSSASTMRNMVVGYRGGAFSRGGLACVGRCKQTPAGTGPPWPIPFQFSITQGYVIEAGDNYFRFVFQGGYVVESGIAITGASNANPCQISVSGTPYANGDWVFFAGVGGMTQLNGQTFIVAGAASGHFTLEDLNGNPVNSTAFGTYTSGGDAYRIYTISTPYAAVDLPYLKFAQAADVMSLTCSNPLTGNEYPQYDLTRLAGDDWTLVQTVFAAVIQPPSRVTATANSLAQTSGSGSTLQQAGINATFSYQVTAVDENGNESVASPTATCHGVDLEVQGGTNTVIWSAVSGALYYNVYRSPPSVDTGIGPSATQNPVPAGSIFGFVGSVSGNQIIDSIAAADLSQTPPTHQNPFARGTIISLTITNAGYSLSTVTWSITTSAGVNFSGYPVVTGGALGAFPVVNPGANYQPGDSIAFNGAGYAQGTIGFGTSGNPANNDTITLNGVVWTFKSTLTGANQTLIQGSLAQTLAVLAANLNASANGSLAVANYAVDQATSTFLVITYGVAGTAGDSYTLAASAANPGASGAVLTGGTGTGGAGAPSATLNVGPESGTYPGVVAYFQQRRFYANSLNNPDEGWASQTGRYANFDSSIPSLPTDAITFSPWTEQVNGIQWLIPMPGGLIAMTGQRAWQLLGEGSYALNAQPITPATTEAQPQAFNGCSPTIQPVVVDFEVLYVASIGNNVWYDLSWNFWTNIYTGADLTILSGHLFENHQIVSRAWARTPNKVLWSVREDGTLLSFTFLKQQEVYGWARHDTTGYVQAVCAVTEPPVDAVYATVLRFTGANESGIYTMERMDDRQWLSVEDSYAVDCGSSNPIAFPQSRLQASAPSGSGVNFLASASVFSSASVGQIIRMNGGIALVTVYINGFDVTGNWIVPSNATQLAAPVAFAGAWSIATPVTSILAPQFANTGGLVALADGVPLSGLSGDALGNVALPFAASDAKVGLGFLPQLQAPYLNAQSAATPQGRRKVIPAVTFRVTGSGTGFQYGQNQPDGAAQNPPQLAPVWSNLATADTSAGTGGQTGAAKYTSPGGGAVTQLWTGDIRVVGSGAAWNSKGQVAIQQPLPLPLEVLAVIPESLEGDIPEETYARQPPTRERAEPRAPGRWMIG